MKNMAATIILSALVFSFPPSYGASLQTPSEETHSREDAERMIRSAERLLAPVYAPLAKQIIEDFDLREKRGIGIDIGSGPGTLLLELCEGTKLHWINADINPHFFTYFLEKASKAGFEDRVSAMFADAQSLPFRDNYADVIVSRGCFFFWEDKPRAFAEIYRVLKPGGVAYVGRGMARDFPIDVAREIRAKQKGNRALKYDPETTAEELRGDLRKAGIRNFQIESPRPKDDPDIHYGVWVTIQKPSVLTENIYPKRRWWRHCPRGRAMRTSQNDRFRKGGIRHAN